MASGTCEFPQLFTEKPEFAPTEFALAWRETANVCMYPEKQRKQLKCEELSDKSSLFSLSMPPSHPQLTSQWTRCRAPHVSGCVTRLACDPLSAMPAGAACRDGNDDLWQRRVCRPRQQTAWRREQSGGVEIHRCRGRLGSRRRRR